MSSKTLELYAERARTIADPSVASGRLLNTKGAERLIVPDVLRKLDLGPDDTLLDVGAGIGTLAIPLSFMVRTVTAIDHPDVLARLSARAPMEGIETIPGNFLDVDLGERRFSRILVYDVLHYLATQEEVIAFVDKAIALLEPNGKLLLGDVRNDHLMQRILNTDEGQRYAAKWTLAKWQISEQQQALEIAIDHDEDLVEFNDNHLLSLLFHVRSGGHHAYLLRQEQGLPLWHQREDILIQKLVMGPKRLQVIAKMSNGAATVIGLREATPADNDLYYVWAQDPVVRASSLRSENFTAAEHGEWFKGKLSDRERTRMYVLEQESTYPIGQIRYELVRAGAPLYSGGPEASATDGAAEVAISIDANARGVRFAKFALDASYSIAKEELGFTVARALIKPDNGSSVKAFMRAGYHQTGESERLGQRVMVLER